MRPLNDTKRDLMIEKYEKLVKDLTLIKAGIENDANIKYDAESVVGALHVQIGTIEGWLDSLYVQKVRAERGTNR